MTDKRVAVPPPPYPFPCTGVSYPVNYRTPVPCAPPVCGPMSNTRGPVPPHFQNTMNPIRPSMPPQFQTPLTQFRTPLPPPPYHGHMHSMRGVFHGYPNSADSMNRSPLQQIPLTTLPPPRMVPPGVQVPMAPLRGPIPTPVGTPAPSGVPMTLRNTNNFGNPLPPGIHMSVPPPIRSTAVSIRNPAPPGTTLPPTAQVNRPPSTVSNPPPPGISVQIGAVRPVAPVGTPIPTGVPISMGPLRPTTVQTIPHCTQMPVTSAPATNLVPALRLATPVRATVSSVQITEEQGNMLSTPLVVQPPVPGVAPLPARYDYPPSYFEVYPCQYNSNYTFSPEQPYYKNAEYQQVQVSYTSPGIYEQYTYSDYSAGAYKKDYYTPSVYSNQSTSTPENQITYAKSKKENESSIKKTEERLSRYDREESKGDYSYRTKKRYGRRRSRSKSKSRTPKLSVRPSYVPLKSKAPISKTERDILLEKWRKNYYATTEEVSSKLEELSKLTQEEIIEREKSFWTRSTPCNLFYKRDAVRQEVVHGTPRLLEICERFNEDLVLRTSKINALKPPYIPPERKKRIRLCRHKTELCHSDSSNDAFSDEEEENIMEELNRKQKHPDRLHPEMWYNDPGEMNDGPLCRCSLKSQKSGIRHGIYAGEQRLKLCDKNTNNADKLYHYKITISPPTNFLTKTPTIIKHDEHEFIFEGFSMFSHFPLVKVPTCKVIRFNIEYTILYIEENHPENFTIQELDLFHTYLFRELLELVDLDFHAAGDTDGCAQFHFMPRFVRDLPDNGREILSMKEVLVYLLESSRVLINSNQLPAMLAMSQYEWQAFADDVKGMVVTYPGKKPCSVRVDQLDRNSDEQGKGKINFPEIVHFGIRPPQLSYAGNPEYQKLWRDYVKFRHLLANMSKPTFEDKRKLEAKEGKLQEMRTQSKMKRDVTVAVSAEGFFKTGIMCDIVQHAMLIPVLVCHLRFHHSLNILEQNIAYKFQNRSLLQLALTHPSYRENFGTNPDHARNSLTNCGIRQPIYGDRRIHYMNTRKRGINTLINIMSRFGKKHETESNITHNERLEFLGDAVVEFLSSIHLFLMFPDLEEGGLATYRAAIVQNQHLAVLAKTLDLDEFMLYAHGSDLCHDLELCHAMANCFEALMGALFLDGGIDVADKVFGRTLFKDDFNLLDIWENLPPHPLQEQEPNGDRHLIPRFEVLQKLTKFEENTGIEFHHIRLLARAFTDRSIGFTNLTLGSNQRLEFLGDTVLQLIASEYLYKYFPEHHEGHLSLLRSSLVNNRTQAVVCDDLGMANYAIYNNPKAELKTKDRADLLEAFIGALYIDQGIAFCQVFCQVTLFPRLQDFIMNQDWNDPKSKLQQCCLTLRTMDGGEPDIPVYKVIECKGPTNTRVYTVAVYFRDDRLAKATGHSIQQAEMNAAKKALEKSKDLFPQLDHQKRVIAKSMKRQKYPEHSDTSGSDTDNFKSRHTRSKSRSPSKRGCKLKKCVGSRERSSSKIKSTDQELENKSTPEQTANKNTSNESHLEETVSSEKTQDVDSSKDSATKERRYSSATLPCSRKISDSLLKDVSKLKDLCYSKKESKSSGSRRSTHSKHRSGSKRHSHSSTSSTSKERSYKSKTHHQRDSSKSKSDLRLEDSAKLKDPECRRKSRSRTRATSKYSHKSCTRSRSSSDETKRYLTQLAPGDYSKYIEEMKHRMSPVYNTNTGRRSSDCDDYKGQNVETNESRITPNNSNTSSCTDQETNLNPSKNSNRSSSKSKNV